MSRTSGSQLDRVVACAASAALPGAFDEVGFAAHRGTDIHRFIHTARARGRDVALLEAPAKLRDFCAAVDIEALDEYIGQYAVAEPAFVYNGLTRSVVYLGSDIDRKYPERKPGDFPFSSDYVDLQTYPSSHVVVVDIKTGRLPVKHPRDNWQFRLGGVGCSIWRKTESALLVKAHLDEEAEWKFEDHAATSMEIDAWSDELHAAALRIEEARAAVAAGRVPDVSPSDDGCTYCPCVTACPDKVGLVRNLPTEIAAMSKRVGGELTLEELGAAWPVVQKMKDLVERIESGIKDVARTTPLPLPNGKRLVVAPENREYIDDTIAMVVLADKFGADALVRAVKQTVSKTSLKAGLGKEQAAAAVEAIRAAGGIDVRTQWMPREEKIK